MVIGEVVGIHIDESVIVNGHVDVTRMKPIARLGYMDYCVVDRLFSHSASGGAGSGSARPKSSRHAALATKA